jgi:hypothetical protein
VTSVHSVTRSAGGEIIALLGGPKSEANNDQRYEILFRKRGGVRTTFVCCRFNDGGIEDQSQPGALMRIHEFKFHCSVASSRQ